MKKLLLASAALFALGASASAADLPARAPAMAPAPVFVGMNWSGFYVGLQAGYLWSDNTITIPQPGGPVFNFTAKPGPDAFSIGGQIGYRHQYANGFVVGVEADVSALLDSRNGGPYFGALGAFPSASEHKWGANRRRRMYSWHRLQLDAHGLDDRGRRGVRGHEQPDRERGVPVRRLRLQDILHTRLGALQDRVGPPDQQGARRPVVEVRLRQPGHGALLSALRYLTRPPGQITNISKTPSSGGVLSFRGAPLRCGERARKRATRRPPFQIPQM
jgi:hypothetical protein